LDNRATVMREIEHCGVVAVIRAPSGDSAVDVAAALADGGVVACEITMTTPRALAAVEAAVQAVGDRAIIGVGTVLDAETARAAILAGARFIVAPTFERRVIELGHRYDVPVMPGAMTPTEILEAWTAGADAVKVFPATSLGPSYFRDLAGPLPQLRLTPTGGVDLDTAADWIDAGAVAIGVGSALVRKDLVAERDWKGLARLAARYVDVVRLAREDRS
jgi:2-dehydro-3-deoxyphosphogluconate aldolase/(4S)-4-hydroxy-2-oxoglutarate aldolase